MIRFVLLGIIALVTINMSPVFGANARDSYWYQSSITTDGGGALDLLAELNYDDTLTNAPIAVVMHGYSPTNGNLANVRGNAEQLRDAGFFVVSVAMRGRDGSDGIRDSGGIEIYDIYDAVESVKQDYPTLVNEDNIHITGYSGGGGNTMSALTKFPDYFRVGAAFFGMSDYGHHPTDAWYFDGSSASHRAQMDTDVGDPTSGLPLVADKYYARASSVASKNNPYSEIHLFVNQNEVTSPVINDTNYRDNAIAAESFAGEFDNISVHIGGLGEYVDFDNDTIDDPEELQNWPHGFLDPNEQHAGQAWYLDRLLNGAIAQPVLNTSDELFVAGFVKTKQFELWLGDGQDAAGELIYALTPTTKTFTLNLLSNDLAKTSVLSVESTDMPGDLIELSINGEVVDLLVGGGTNVLENIEHGDTVLLESVGQTGGLGDFNLDMSIDQSDYATFIEHFTSNMSTLTLFEAYQLGDMNGDRVSDFDDLALFRQAFDEANGPGAFAAFSTSVPEPSTCFVLSLGLLLIANKRPTSRVSKPLGRPQQSTKPRDSNLWVS